MLTNLFVKNLALIDEINIDFKDGLTVLTGETGAGKSIILGAIGIALGAKPASDIVRDEDKEAVTQLSFCFDKKESDLFLKLYEMGIDFNDEDVLIIRRSIISGRSRFKINGCDVPSSLVKDIAPYLLDLHAQRDNLRLLKDKEQLILVDTFAGEDAKRLKLNISDKLSALNMIKEKLDDLDEDESIRKRELDLLRFEVQELDSACLKYGEDTELEENYNKGENAGKIKESALSAINCITGDTDSVSSFVSSAISSVEDIAEINEDDEIKNIKDMLYDVESIISDCSRELDSYLCNIDIDEEEFSYITERLNTYNRLKDKYKTDTSGLIKQLEEKRTRITDLENSDDLIRKYKEEQSRISSELEKLCDALSEKRKEAAGVISDKLIKAAKNLNFNDIRFKIDIVKTGDITGLGNNKAVFLISTNPGEDIKPLKDVASGGELSRIMLAFKTITAETDFTETLIFDEIDTGISGKTAQKVAAKIADTAKNTQIICITHLPQIAAMGDHHYLINKTVGKNRSVTDINLLDEQERVFELSRLLGGEIITDNVKNNAKELLDQAAKIKKEDKG